MRLALALAAAAFLLAGCSSEPAPAPTTSAATTGPTSASTHIEVVDDRFDPTRTTVDPQTTLHFANEGKSAHTVTVHKMGTPNDQIMGDTRLEPGEGVGVRFDDAGTYHVWCKYHGTMTTGMAMTVTVE